MFSLMGATAKVGGEEDILIQSILRLLIFVSPLIILTIFKFIIKAMKQKGMIN